MTETNADRMRALFAQDGFAHGLGVELIDVDDDSVTLEVTIGERHVGWHGRCHGGVLFSVADIAMSYVGNRLPGRAYAIAASIEFLQGVSLGERVVVTTTETARRGRSGVCDTKLSVDGEIVGLFRGRTQGVRTNTDQDSATGAKNE